MISPTSRLYMDFDPVNILVTSNLELVVIDPPSETATDSIYFDIGVFLLGLTRAPWSRPWTLAPYAARSQRLRETFLASYGGPDPADARVPMLLTLVEIMRLGQLWRWWLDPFGFNDRAMGLVRATYAYPWLVNRRRRLAAALEHHVRALA
jgi:hypothetical protein